VPAHILRDAGAEAGARQQSLELNYYGQTPLSTNTPHVE